MTGFLYGRLARFTIGPEETLTAGLAGIGHTPKDVTTVVFSHLHQDHIGGLREVDQADLLASQTELDSVDKPRAELDGYLRRHIELPGLRWRPVQFEKSDDPTFAPFSESHDVFGDGSLVLLPLPGHTPGSMAMLVRRPERPPLLLAGDVTYRLPLMESGRVPGVGNRRVLRESAAKVVAMRRHEPHLVILPAHDPAGAASLRAVSDGVLERSVYASG